MLENDADRIHRPDEDGLPMRSFWNRKGQSVANGAFFPADRHQAMNRKTPEYVREHLKQWQEILKHVEPSSSR